jgi:hypothetical protein
VISCLSFLSTGIIDVHHQDQPVNVFFKKKKKTGAPKHEALSSSPSPQKKKDPKSPTVYSEKFQTLREV